MFNRKEKIGFEVFVRQHYLPLITEMVDNEVDSLQTEINRNSPPIQFSKDQTKFELFILFLKVSGYGLSQVKGLEQFYGQLNLLEDDFLSNEFAHVELNPKLLVGRENALIFSDHWLYMSNKIKGYAKYEQAYHRHEISQQDLPFIISAIFFAPICDRKTINEPLALAIGELHKGGLIYLHQRLFSLAKKYQIIPDI